MIITSVFLKKISRRDHAGMKADMVISESLNLDQGKSWACFRDGFQVTISFLFPDPYKENISFFFSFFFFSGSVSHCSTFFFFTFSYLWENEVPSVLLCNPSTCVPHGWDICNYNFLLFCSTLILPLPPSRNEANKKTNKPTELHRI